MKKIRFLSLFFLTLFVLSSAGAQEPTGPRITTDLEVNGRIVRVTDENPYSVREHQVRDQSGRHHTVRAYGSMWITFMASMIATELIFCSNQMLPWIANNEETPNCRDELETMLLDPGMSLGVLAMTFTSIEVYRRGDSVLKRFARRLLLNQRGQPANRQRIHRGLSLSRTVLQHLAMGAGMIVQTSVASTYNSPFMKECFADIKNRVRHLRSSNTNPDEESVTAAIDTAQAGENCKNAQDYFFNSEDGTMSEIYITTISVGISSVVAGTLISTIRLAGMVLLRVNPMGNIATTTGLILANPVIDIIDRYLEPIIRQAYHMNRSKRHLSYSFNQLIDSLNDYKENNQFLQTYQRRTTCLQTVERTRNRREYCSRWATETVYASKILDTLKSHKYNIDYRRRANLNRFMEAHNRWTQKVSTMLSNIGVFQSVMRQLFIARENALRDSSLRDKNYFSPLTKTSNPEEFFNHFNPNTTQQLFSQEQITVIYQLMNRIRNRIGNHSYDQNIEIRRLLEQLHVSIHRNNKQNAQAILWALKKAISPQYLSRFNYSNTVRTGSPLTEEEINSLKQTITEIVTSFNPLSTQSYQQFAMNQIDFLDEYEVVEETTSAAEPMGTRRGVSLSENDPLSSLLLVNKDDGYAHVDEPSFWTSAENRGILAMTVPSRILTHISCGDFQDIHFSYNEGREAKILFPNILKNPEKINCSLRRNALSFPLLNEYSPENDFWPNPASQQVSLLEIDPTLHNIYIYDQKPHVGLLDIVADPTTELRWANQAEFDQFWQNELWPRVTLFLVQLKSEYFVTLGDFFDMRLRCQTRGVFDLLSWGQSCSSYSLNDNLTDQEVLERNAGYFNTVDKTYYSRIGLAESFIDEIRTYVYVLEKMTDDGDTDRAKLNNLKTTMRNLLTTMDISQRNLNFEWEDLSHEQRLELMFVPGIYQVMGDQAVAGFFEHYEVLQNDVNSRITELQATGINLEDYSSNPSRLAAFPASDVVKLQIYTHINSSLHYLVNNLLMDYLAGNNIIYIKNE